MYLKNAPVTQLPKSFPCSICCDICSTKNVVVYSQVALSTIYEYKFSGARLAEIYFSLIPSTAVEIKI